MVIGYLLLFCWLFMKCVFFLYCWFYCGISQKDRVETNQSTRKCVLCQLKGYCSIKTYQKTDLPSFACLSNMWAIPLRGGLIKELTISIWSIKKIAGIFLSIPSPFFPPWVISSYTIPPLSHAWLTHAFIIIKIDLSLCLPSCRFPPRLTLWVRANTCV